MISSKETAILAAMTTASHDQVGVNDKSKRISLSTCRSD